MVVQQTHTAAVVMVLAAAAAVTVMAGPATTFLAVAQDMAPPPLPTTNTNTNTTTMAINLAKCGQLCFAATVEHCLAFVWRSNLPPKVLVTTSNTRNSSNRKSAVGEGRCELLSCLPHPASLLPSPGAHLFVIKIGDSTIPPPTFTQTLVPSSYSMACTFAFRVFTTPKLSYWEAHKHCAWDGARLVVFKSPKEEESISVAIKTSGKYWIGLTDSQTEGVWRWADQSKLTYSNWDSDQPNNYLVGDKDQDCVMLLKGRWNDHQCRDALGFICQVPLLNR